MAEVIIGKGQHWEIKPGVYQYRFSLGKDPMTGKYRYSSKKTLHCESKSQRGREAELRTAMETYKQELITGITAPKSTAKTVGEYADEFHALRKGTLGSDRSYRREDLEVRHIKELFGPIQLKALKASHIKAAYAEARKTGRFSESELHKIHTKLKQILKTAVDDELLTKNPCANISVPRPASAERDYLEIDEARRLLECLTEEELNSHTIGVMLMLDSGIRRGEMLGLTWKNVDLNDGAITISQQFAKDKVLRAPKSDNSKRTIGISSGMVAILKEWKRIQEEEMNSMQLAPIENTPVVTNDLSKHMDPDNYNRWFRNWCVDHDFGKFGKEYIYVSPTGRRSKRKIDYTGLTPHMLRHTQATLLIASGTDLKTVSARLGHSSIALTLNIYSHAIKAKDKEAANAFGDMLSKSVESSGN